MRYGKGVVLGLSLCLSLVGCSSSEDDDQSGDTLDGGGDTQTDGAAPGSGDAGSDASSDSSTPVPVEDAGDDDAMDATTREPDAAVSDAGDGAVEPSFVFRVRVISEELGPLEGARVVFSDALGNNVGEHATDPSGYVAVAAASEVPRAVTVLNPLRDSDTPQLVTFLATEEGDDLVVRFDASNVQLAPDRGFDLTLPAINPDPDVFDFQAGGLRQEDVSRSALLAASGSMFSVAPERLAESNAVLMRARDLDDIGVTFAYARDVPKPAAGETAALTLTGWSVDFLGLDLQNVTPTPNLYATDLYMEAQGWPFRSEEYQFSNTTIPGYNLRYSAEFADSLTVLGRMRYNYSPRLYQAVLANRPVPNPSFTTVVVDMALPTLDGFSVNAVDGDQDAGTPGSVSMDWSTAGDVTLPGADAQFAVFAWGQDIAGQPASPEWIVMIPPDVSSFVFPVIAIETDELVPEETNTTPSFTVLDDSRISSYRAFRQQVLDLSSTSGGIAPVPTLPLYFDVADPEPGDLRVVSAWPNSL